MANLFDLKASSAQFFKRVQKSRVALVSLSLLGACNGTLPPSAMPQTMSGSGGPDQPGVLITSAQGTLTRGWVCDAGSGLGSVVQLTNYSPKTFIGIGTIGDTSMRDTITIGANGFFDFYYTDQPHGVITAQGGNNGIAQQISIAGPQGFWAGQRNAQQIPPDYAAEFPLADQRAQAALAIVARDCQGPFPDTFQSVVAVPNQNGMETAYADVQIGPTRLRVYRGYRYEGVVGDVGVSGYSYASRMTLAINGVPVPAYNPGGAVVTITPGSYGVTYGQPDPTPQQKYIMMRVLTALEATEPVMGRDERRVNGYFPSGGPATPKPLGYIPK